MKSPSRRSMFFRLPLLLWLWSSTSSVGHAWAVSSSTQRNHHHQGQFFQPTRMRKSSALSRQFHSHTTSTTSLDDEGAPHSQSPQQQQHTNNPLSWITTHLRGGGSHASHNILRHFALPPLRALMAEALGTFLIVFLGTGSVLTAVTTGAYTNNLVSLATVWIIAVTLAIVCTAPISGAHLNPAMTWAFTLLRPTTTTTTTHTKRSISQWSLCLWYSLAQLFGAVLGSITNFGLYAHHLVKYEAQNQIVRGSRDFAAVRATASCFGEYPSVPLLQAFLVEAIGTAILSAVVFAVTHPKQPTEGSIPPPLLIGATVGGLISVLAPLTQAGFNPARDFGPRIVAAVAAGFHPIVAFRSAWIYILGPMVGAPLGGWFIERVVYSDDNTTTQTIANN